MFRNLLFSAALAVALVPGIQPTLSAQPPSPAEVGRTIDRGVHRAVTGTHRTVRRVTHRARRTRWSHRHVTHVVRRSVRTVCNDGRVHTGRTRVTACAGHGGIRG